MLCCPSKRAPDVVETSERPPQKLTPVTAVLAVPVGDAVEKDLLPVVQGVMAESPKQQGTLETTPGLAMDETSNFIEGAKYSQIDIIGDAKNRTLPWLLEHGGRLCRERGAHAFFYQQHGNGHEIMGFYQTASDMRGYRVRHGHDRGFVAAPLAFAMDETSNFIEGAKYSQIDIIGKAKNRSLPWLLEYGGRLCRERGAHAFFYQQHGNGHEIMGFYQTAIDMCGRRGLHGHRRGFVAELGPHEQST